jgi:hypothetical protein
MASQAATLSRGQARRRRRPPKHVVIAALLYALGLLNLTVIAMMVFAGPPSPGHVASGAFSWVVFLYVFRQWRRDFKRAKQAFENDEPPPHSMWTTDLPLTAWIVFICLAANVATILALTGVTAAS